MRVVTIGIDRARVLAAVARLTAYEGSRNPDVSPTGETVYTTYERVFTTEADEELLDEFLRQFISTTATVLRDKLVQAAWDGTGNVMQFDLRVWDTFPSLLRPEAANQLFDAAKYFVAALWFNHTDKPLVESYTKMAVGELHSLEATLETKTPPQRPK